RQGSLHHLYQRRQQVLRDDPGLLRLPQLRLRMRLLLLLDDQQYARLLWLLRIGQDNREACQEWTLTTAFSRELLRARVERSQKPAANLYRFSLPRGASRPGALSSRACSH